ncbi:LOW QUALITY PROTEIN: vicilin-like seed storage protein At2g28490 [Abrus precatorius]|uniref:LOW QUALITY PROTEIN: vicilin-like seed storage protein At2g28490 n=1 Tax=Abrus precatorius TaxID=3816 RepID=A0A8B8KHU9_ABRPR|nr:LOW QUALITY PROTEIN: vicilin-like seed storage protein At2g28490 [Abrus precatorius]
MGNRGTLLVLLLVFCHGVAITMGFWMTEGKEREERSARADKMFMMQKSKRVAKTDAGEMRVLESYGGRILERALNIGFITMEPRSLFIPQYLDSSLIIFLRTGEAKLGFIYKDELAERHLKTGDVYQIPAGSAFYLVNIEESQRLHIICSIDPSESLGIDIFQSFYIGGGANPASVLSGFEPEILEAAFNVSGADLRRLLSKQHEGPIVHVGDSHATSIWTKFLQLKEEEKLQHLRNMVQELEEESDEEEQQTSFSWRKLLESVFGDENKNTRDYSRKSPHSCNLYDRKPDFMNNYGWSVAIDGYDYSPLKSSGVGIYHVNLTAGSMMSPHVNPRATEYGIVLKGSGRIQIVFPNGSNAMDTHVKEGDVFFIPRYFAFCQIASRNEPLEFFGFTTSAQRNKPYFLVGATSLMRTMMGPELAAAFGVSEDTIDRVAKAQHEAVILPTPWAAHEHQNREKVDTLPKLIRNKMIMGF